MVSCPSTCKQVLRMNWPDAWKFVKICFIHKIAFPIPFNPFITDLCQQDDPTGYRIPCPVMYTLLHNSMRPFAGTSPELVLIIMKSLLEKDIFPFHMIPKSSGYLFYFPWPCFIKTESFVHKCVAFHSTNGYWKDWLVLRLISIIATCRLGYTIREIRVWTEKKEQNSVSLFRHSNRGLITKATIGSPVGKRPPFAKRVQNIWEVLRKC